MSPEACARLRWIVMDGPVIDMTPKPEDAVLFGAGLIVQSHVGEHTGTSATAAGVRKVEAIEGGYG